MIRKVLFILFVLTLAGSLGLIVLDKLKHEQAVAQCKAEGGRWNYMEQDCDRQRSKN